MADKKISALDSANPIQAEDQFVVAQSGSTKQVGLTGLINAVCDGVITPDGAATGNGATAGSVNALVDDLRDGTLVFPGTTATSEAAGYTALRLGVLTYSGGIELKVVRKNYGLATAVTAVGTTIALPTGCVVLGTCLYVKSTISDGGGGDTATAIGLGIADTPPDPDYYCVTDGLTLGDGGEFMFGSWAKQTAAINLSPTLYACQTDGTITGTEVVTGGSIYIVMAYLTATAMS